ncbi:MAG TPA: peptidylprolyl isomerase [Geobacterales bacterium]|nr:peptidylprolyl isomerase [Geobacterales bacterium]
MTRSLRYLVIATLIAALPLTSSAVAASTKEKKSAEAPKSATIATVNGSSISRKELDLAVKIMMEQNQVAQPTPELASQMEEAVTQQLISSELLYQAGSKLKIADLDKQVAEKLSERKARYATPEKFQEEIGRYGMTEKDLDQLVRKSIVISNYIEQEIASKVTVSADDAKKFYDDNQDKFKMPESIRASHILVAVDASASKEDKEKSRKLAEDILKRVKKGEDFAEVAKKESKCPSATVGGDLGYFAQGQMVPPFEEAAFKLKVGEISDVVETKFGYHIIKVTDKKPAGTTPFDEVKERIMEYLKGQQIQKAIMQRVEELHKGAKITIANGAAAKK